MARILLIDDDDSVRNVLRLILNQFGHLVIEARNGREGMELFMDANADLVITDIVMPEKEGLEVLMEMRKMSPAMKIIAISGGGRVNPTDYLRMAGFLGAAKVLAKPISSEALIGAINEVLLAAGGAPAQPHRVQ
jgi:YesN/AraC family two-component response regulator